MRDAVCEQGFRTQRSMRTTIVVFASSLIEVRRKNNWVINYIRFISVDIFDNGAGYFGNSVESKISLCVVAFLISVKFYFYIVILFELN